jgi:hypothetical protein
MLPLYHDPHFTLRFADDRIIFRAQARLRRIWRAR